MSISAGSLNCSASLRRFKFWWPDARASTTRKKRVAEVEDTAVLKLDATKARLAPALNDFHVAIREFTVFLANVPIADSQVFTPYKFAETSQKLKTLYDTELSTALGRWHSAVQTVVIQIQRVTPDDWKSKALSNYDATYIKAKILNKDLVTALGTDYLVASAWLTSI